MKLIFITDATRIQKIMAIAPDAKVVVDSGYHKIEFETNLAHLGFGLNGVSIFGGGNVGPKNYLEIPNELFTSLWIEQK